MSHATTFQDLFATGDTRQDNFRSRLFGMFSEDIVRFWARGDAPYRALDGRPTIYEGTAYATIDFTLERRADGRLFIAEQKAELAWMKYAYLRLDKRGAGDPPPRATAVRLVPRSGARADKTDCEDGRQGHHDRRRDPRLGCRERARTSRGNGRVRLRGCAVA